MIRSLIKKLLYICVSFWLLAHESLDVSLAETKIKLLLKADHMKKKMSQNEDHLKVMSSYFGRKSLLAEN